MLTESRLTRWYDRFRALSALEWIPRLLGPEEVFSLCGGEVRDEAEVLGASRFCAYRLPTCVLHPGCLPHSSKTLEGLVGLSTEDVMALVYQEGGAPALRTRLVTTAGFAFGGGRPEWMVPEVVPLPGGAQVDAATRAALDGLLTKAARQRRLIEMAPPEIILEGEQRNVQHAFDALYLAVCDWLEARENG